MNTRISWWYDPITQEIDEFYRDGSSYCDYWIERRPEWWTP